MFLGKKNPLKPLFSPYSSYRYEIRSKFVIQILKKKTNYVAGIKMSIPIINLDIKISTFTSFYLNLAALA